MGWIAGAWKPTKEIKQQITEVCDTDTCLMTNERITIFGDGLSDTFFYDIPSDEGRNAWTVSGIGISPAPDPLLMGKKSWGNLLNNNISSIHTLNGHFAALRWSGHHLDFYTDQFGLKNFYFHQRDGAILFSTRLDILLKLARGCSINWENFGSRWTATHQFSIDSFIDGVDRLSQGGKATIFDGNLRISHKRWLPSGKTATSGQALELLSQFATLPMQAGNTVSLGLSGGFDSRVLLSLLMAQENPNWRLHTFGTDEHPDRFVADQLAEIADKTQLHLPEPNLSSDEIIAKLPSFIGQTLFTISPHALVRLSAYSELRKPGMAVIDGAFGEIARRRLAQRIYFKKRGALKKERFEGLIPLFKYNRADILTYEVNRKMHTGFREELLSEFSAMPSAKETGAGNWLDIFSMRTHAPNGGGPEQSRSDSELFNYMAYLQPDFVDAVLSLPMKERRNANLLRSQIKTHTPELQSVPLVKGIQSYPYTLNDSLAAIWMKLKRQFGSSYHDTTQFEFLRTLEEYIQDLVHSRSVHEYPAYDGDKLQTLVRKTFTENDPASASQLEWWLAFETFRQLVESNET